MELQPGDLDEVRMQGRTSAHVGLAAGVSLPNRMGEVYATIVNGPGYTSRERDRFKDFAIRLSLLPCSVSFEIAEGTLWKRCPTAKTALQKRSSKINDGWQIQTQIGKQGWIWPKSRPIFLRLLNWFPCTICPPGKWISCAPAGQILRPSARSWRNSHLVLSLISCHLAIHAGRDRPA